MAPAERQGSESMHHCRGLSFAAGNRRGLLYYETCGHVDSHCLSSVRNGPLLASICRGSSLALSELAGFPSDCSRDCSYLVLLSDADIAPLRADSTVILRLFVYLVMITGRMNDISIVDRVIWTKEKTELCVCDHCRICILLYPA